MAQISPSLDLEERPIFGFNISKATAGQPRAELGRLMRRHPFTATLGLPHLTGMLTSAAAQLIVLGNYESARCGACTVDTLSDPGCTKEGKNLSSQPPSLTAPPTGRENHARIAVTFTLLRVASRRLPPSQTDHAHRLPAALRLRKSAMVWALRRTKANTVFYDPKHQNL
ncbi:hypothetical protein SKAU_G00401930 [Synaphobranchus kaupii]|uniref:Uncharacterized protein n=1 Tax=Synaphobranchus kaupii TaxID=118154 RepID=A0A9Q1E988_SYNKA|nr:hypothetical protein SKAU_G00401930 [Synaphobranchus kaupii]